MKHPQMLSAVFSFPGFRVARATQVATAPALREVCRALGGHRDLLPPHGIRSRSASSRD